MKKVLYRIINNSYLKAFLTLSSGTAISHVISIIASPIMTRLYSPEDIGVYTVIYTCVGMFGAIVAGRYDMAIITEKTEDNVYTLIKLTLFITLASSVFLGFFYSIFYYSSKSISLPFFILFLLTLSLLFFYGIFLVLSSYNNRKKQYELISKSSIIESTIRETVMIIGGIIYANPIILALSQIIGKAVNVFCQSRELVTHKGKVKDKSLTQVLRIAYDYKDQPLFSVPALFANSFSYSSINLFVELLFGAASLGFYSISNRVLGIPLALVSTNISKIYFREASLEYDRKNSYVNTLVRTSILLIFIAIPVVLIMIWLGPIIFGWIFGEEWIIAGEYVQILAPMYGFRLVVSPLTTGMIISNKQKYELLIQSLFLIVSILIFLVVHHFQYPIKIYLYFISFTFSLLYLIYYCILFKLAKKPS